jgi:hypothetical protein
MTAEPTDNFVSPPIDPDSAMDVFTAPEGKGLDVHVAKVRALVADFSADATTEEGRKAAKAFAYKIVRSKTILDDAGKTLVAKLKELPKTIDANRKRMRDALDALAEQVRAPVAAWEAVETARKDKHVQRINELALLGSAVDSMGNPLTADQIKANIAALMAFIPPADEDFFDEYRLTVQQARDKAQTAFAARVRYEAEQVELASLRAAQAEREEADRRAALALQEARNRENEARNRELEAASKEHADRLAQEAEARRVSDAALAHERAENARLKSEADAAEAQRKRDADAIAAREADHEHRRKVNGRAASTIALLLAGDKISAEAATDGAKAIVRAIATGNVPSVSIAY